MTNFVQIPFVLETTVPVEEKTTKTERSVVIPVKEAALSVAVRAGSRGNATVFSTRTGGASVASPQTNEKGAVPFWLQEGSYTLSFSGGSPAIAPVSIDWDAVGGSGVQFIAAESVTTEKLAAELKTTIAGAASKAEVTTAKGEAAAAKAEGSTARSEVAAKILDAGSHPLRIQTGVFVIPGFGGGTWSFEITLPFAWPTAHVAFLAGSAISPTENKGWPSAGEVSGKGTGHIKGIGAGPNFESASVTWVSLGY